MAREYPYIVTVYWDGGFRSAALVGEDEDTGMVDFIPFTLGTFTVERRSRQSLDLKDRFNRNQEVELASFKNAMEKYGYTHGAGKAFGLF